MQTIVGGGDFNIRTGDLGGIGMIERDLERLSKDTRISKNGKRLNKLGTRERLVHFEGGKKW